MKTGIDDHEKPRYTTRRLRYEIEQAVMAERRRCAEAIKGLPLLAPATTIHNALLAEWRQKCVNAINNS